MHDVSILEHAKQACAYCKNSKIDFIKFTEKKLKKNQMSSFVVCYCYICPGCPLAFCSKCPAQ